MFCVIVKIISFFLGKISRKQTAAGRERAAKIKQLQQESGGDRDALTDKIYDYYKESNYNPVLNFFSKFVIIAVNFAILTAFVSTFSPITNYKVITDENAQKIVSIYKENEPDATQYTEMRLLNDLEKYENQYKKAGVSNEEIQRLYNLRDSLTLGKLKTYMVPTIKNFSPATLIPIVAFILYLIKFLLDIIRQLKSLKDSFGSLDITGKLTGILSPFMSVFSLVLVSTIILKTPIIVSFYFIINYLWGIGQYIIENTKSKNIKSEGKYETKNSIKQKTTE